MAVAAAGAVTLLQVEAQAAQAVAVLEVSAVVAMLRLTQAAVAAVMAAQDQGAVMVVRVLSLLVT
jgi:hypothetical protein